ncbi:MAG: hypothetical protein ABIX10_10965 [Acidimicrobiales bacterium]
MTARADSSCPTCGQRGIPIVYGLPDHGLMEAAQREEVALGGCMVRGDDPAFQCAAGHRWGADR